MPIEGLVKAGMIHTILSGRVTDADLLSYYKLPMFELPVPPWLEIVDARQIVDMAVTVNGQRELALLVLTRVNQLRGGRVAMVAESELTYGMFRMWEVLKPDIDYEVRVFRKFLPARDWVISKLEDL